MVSKIKPKFLQINTINQYLSLVGIIQPENKIEYWSFAYPTPPHDSCKRILLDFEVKIVEDVVWFVHVSETYIFELNLPSKTR